MEVEHTCMSQDGSNAHDHVDCTVSQSIPGLALYAQMHQIINQSDGPTHITITQNFYIQTAPNLKMIGSEMKHEGRDLNCYKPVTKSEAVVQKHNRTQPRA